MNAFRPSLHDGPSAWSLTFLDQEKDAPPDQGILVCQIRYPIATMAHVERIPFRQTADLDIASFLDRFQLPVILLPAGSGTPFELQKKADEWMSGPAIDGSVPSICEVPLRGGRLRWRADRVLAVVGMDHVCEALAAIAYFSWFSQQVAAMEELLDAEWPQLHTDALFVGSTPPNRTDRDRLAYRAVEMFQRRQRFMCLTIGLEQPDCLQVGPARRIFLELTNQEDMASRLKLIDDAIEVAEDLYEHVNERVTERGYFLRGMVAETAILVAILADLAFSVWDAF